MAFKFVISITQLHILLFVFYIYFFSPLPITDIMVCCLDIHPSLLVYISSYTMLVFVCFNKLFNVFMYFFIFAHLCAVNQVDVVIESSIPFDVG